MLSTLLVGNDAEKLYSAGLELLAEHQLSYFHPDVLYFEPDKKIGIGETIKVKEFLSIKPISGHKAVVFGDAELISQLAQNSLLKAIEELEDHGVVLFLGNSKDTLIPTILSRVRVVNIEEGPREELELSEADKWLNASLEDKYKSIEKMDDKEIFWHKLMKSIRQKLSQNEIDVGFAEQILRGDEFWQANGNQRAILEWLALEWEIGKKS